jgi:hypothetical protein
VHCRVQRAPGEADAPSRKCISAEYTKVVEMPEDNDFTVGINTLGAQAEQEAISRQVNRAVALGEWRGPRAARACAG